MKMLSAIFCVMLLTFTGCGGKSGETVEPSDAAKSILENVSFADDLVEATSGIVSDRYFFDDKVSEYSVYIGGSGATAEEIAVIRTSDVDSAKAAAERRVEDLKFNFENYVPAEMAKLSEPVIVTRGDVVFLVICDDPPQAQKAIDNLFK